MSILNYFSREENVPGLPSVESTPELRCKELSAANKRVGEQYLRQEELRRMGSKRPRGEYIDWKESERAEIGRYAIIIQYFLISYSAKLNSDQ